MASRLSTADWYKKPEVQVTLNPDKRMKLLVERSKPPAEIPPEVPLARLLRSMLEMNRLGDQYRKGNNPEMAFSYYYRFVTILVETLGKRDDYETSTLAEKKMVVSLHKEVFDQANHMKARTKEVYEREAAALKAKLEAMKADEEQEQRRLAEDIVFGRIVQPSAPPPSNFFTEKQLDELSPSAKKLTAVNICSHLLADFLEAASENTRNNRETCAVLSGRLDQRYGFVVTHVLIPNQQGTSDSCETLDEEDLDRYQEENELYSLGWIHTHPSQTAFLSSIDLHMQNSFQVLLDEAIAIVCAPSHQSSGVYTLTNAGRQYLSNCRETGHHHHDTMVKLYEEASHVFYTEKKNFKIVDFRR